MIKAVGFDWGGVISGKPGGSFSRDVSKVLGIHPDDHKKAHFKHNRLVNIESYSYEEYWKVLLKELGKEEMLNEVVAFSKSRVPNELNKEVVDLIVKLKNNNYKVGLLSNGGSLWGKNIRESAVAKHFDSIVVSADIGFMKPEKEAFESLIVSLGVKPGELVFVDDTPQSLISATEVGYHPVLFTGYKKLVADLSHLGVNVE